MGGGGDFASHQEQIIWILVNMEKRLTLSKPPTPLLQHQLVPVLVQPFFMVGNFVGGLHWYSI